MLLPAHEHHGELEYLRFRSPNGTRVTCICLLGDCLHMDTKLYLPICATNAFSTTIIGAETSVTHW